MEVSQRNSLFFVVSVAVFSIILSGQEGFVSAHPKHLFNFKPTKLFVFGDSYSDTGNNRKSQALSWKYPYGITFPGKPTGRFSDGRVLTDFLARFIGVRSPVAYQWRKVVPRKQLKHGMNFAHGGTGVFDTLIPDANMTTQITFFQRLINDSVFGPRDIRSSVALVTVAGNDYGAYLFKNGTQEMATSGHGRKKLFKDWKHLPYKKQGYFVSLMPLPLISVIKQ